MGVRAVQTSRNPNYCPDDQWSHMSRCWGCGEQPPKLLKCSRSASPNHIGPLSLVPGKWAASEKCAKRDCSSDDATQQTGAKEAGARKNVEEKEDEKQTEKIKEACRLYCSRANAGNFAGIVRHIQRAQYS